MYYDGGKTIIILHFQTGNQNSNTILLLNAVLLLICIFLFLKGLDLVGSSFHKTALVWTAQVASIKMREDDCACASKIYILSEEHRVIDLGVF